MKYCIVTYGGRIIDIPDSGYEALAKIVENPHNQFVVIAGNRYAINDFRYMGEKKNAPSIKQGNESVPAHQKEIAENNYGQFLLTGVVANLPSNIRDKMKKIMDDHIARRPELDEANDIKRREAHEEWVSLARIEQGDPGYKYIFD